MGRRILSGPALACFARQLRGTERKNNGSSARNRLSGVFTEVVPGDVSARVEIQAGPFPVVAMVSRGSAGNFGWSPVFLRPP